MHVKVINNFIAERIQAAVKVINIFLVAGNILAVKHVIVNSLTQQGVALKLLGVSSH